nr:retrovirus-related Pol polyprotein from transposon TNT 1-94 [Tanacetum cinerariifolium]
DKLVCWSSKKQNYVSISTTESEYVAVSSCCAQVLWMRTQLTDYGFFYDNVPIFCDSKSAIAISCNPNCPKCGKLVDGHYCQGCALLRKKFKEDLFTYCVENGILQDSSEPSNDNPNVVNAPREPFVGNQDPGKNSSQNPPRINHHCCYGCGDPLEAPIIPDLEPFNNQTIKELLPTVQRFDPKFDLVHDSPNVFDPPSQLPFITCEFCENDSRYGHYCTPQVSFVYPKPCYNQDFNFSQDLHDFQHQYLCFKNYGLLMKLTNEEEKQIEEDQEANARYWNIPACYDDDDDDDYTFAITPNEPDNSLSMGDAHLDTISATESDKFIKSSVKNLVPNPSESEGEYECDMPACEVFTTFSNILFDSDYDFYSSDDQSFSDEDIQKEIYSNPLFDEEIISIKIDPHDFNAESDLTQYLLNHDSSIISSLSKMDSLFDEFAGELTLLKAIPPGIDETDCAPEDETHFIKRLLYDNSSPRLSKEFVSENFDAEIESFSPSPIPVEDSDSLMEEIDLSFTPDYPMPPGVEEDDYDSERDILILEEFLSNNSISLPENESFHFDIPSLSRPTAKPPDGNTTILNVKIMGDIFKQKVPMPRLMITLIPKQEKSPDLLSHLGHEAFQPSAECPKVIHGKNTHILDVPLFHFYPP